MTSFDKWLDEMTAEISGQKVAPSPYCANCENGGWIGYGLGWGDPHFRECQECGNPEDLPSP